MKYEIWKFQMLLAMSTNPPYELKLSKEWVLFQVEEIQVTQVWILLLIFLIVFCISISIYLFLLSELDKDSWHVALWAFPVSISWESVSCEPISLYFNSLHFDFYVMSHEKNRWTSRKNSLSGTYVPVIMEKWCNTKSRNKMKKITNQFNLCKRDAFCRLSCMCTKFQRPC